MAQAYTPGLQLSASTRVEKIRELPLPGKVLVQVGDKVSAATQVLSAERPGELDILRIADRLGFEPPDVVPHMKVKVGDTVHQGQRLCEMKTFFGLFQNEVCSPIDGTVEFFLEANAHLGLRHPSVPLTVNAYIDGIVTNIEAGKSVTIECEASLIQGIFGVGGERHGTLHVLAVDNSEVVEEKHLPENLAGKVLIGGASFTSKALQKAASLQASAVITGSIEALTLKNFVGYEIGVSITGDEEVPFTLIITEGFGNLAISARIIDLAKQLTGKFCSVNGATQVRAGALRPEIIVARTQLQQTSANLVPTSARGPSANTTLEVGAMVRVVRVPYFGQMGNVIALPQEPMRVPSGAIVRVVNIKLHNGQEVMVPRANVELLPNA